MILLGISTAPLLRARLPLLFVSEVLVYRAGGTLTSLVHSGAWGGIWSSGQSAARHLPMQQRMQRTSLQHARVTWKQQEEQQLLKSRYNLQVWQAVQHWHAAAAMQCNTVANPLATAAAATPIQQSSLTQQQQQPWAATGGLFGLIWTAKH